MQKPILSALAIALAFTPAAHAETPEEWIKLGARVEGSFGSLVPLGIRIGEDALRRLKADRRGVTVTFHAGENAPCTCLADGIALATVATVGQRTMTISSEDAEDGDLADIVIRSKATGASVRYAVPDAVLPKLQACRHRRSHRG